MTREIRSYARTSTYSVLTPDQERAVHEHALAVLDRVGVSTTNDRLLKVMADEGQRVDFDAKRIRFDPAFVEEKRALAPHAYTLHARDPELDLSLG
ncbi:MAG: trimethylamine methyltransferase family protein, partial [Actinomycetota bacterium]